MLMAVQSRECHKKTKLAQHDVACFHIVSKDVCFKFQRTLKFHVREEDQSSQEYAADESAQMERKLTYMWLKSLLQSVMLA